MRPPPPTPLPLGPPNAQRTAFAFALRGRRASFAGRPDRSQNLLVQGEEGHGAEEAVRYLRAKDLKGGEEGEPQGVVET